MVALVLIMYASIGVWIVIGSAFIVYDLYDDSETDNDLEDFRCIV